MSEEQVPQHMLSLSCLHFYMGAVFALSAILVAVAMGLLSALFHGRLVTVFIHCNLCNFTLNINAKS